MPQRSTTRNSTRSGILVDDGRGRRVRVLAERIAQFLVANVGLGGARDRLQADRAGVVRRIHQARVVRRQADAKQLRARGEAGALGGRQLDHGGELVGGRQHVRELPAPIVPLRIGDVGAPHGRRARRCDRLRRLGERKRAMRHRAVCSTRGRRRARPTAPTTDRPSRRRAHDRARAIGRRSAAASRARTPTRSARREHRQRRRACRRRRARRNRG